MEKNRIFSFKQWKFEPNYEILQFLSKKEGFLLLFQQLEDEDQFLCGESQCWSWSRKNPSSPAPAGSLQLRAPLLRSQKLGALNHTLLTPGLVIDTNCECFNPRKWNQNKNSSFVSILWTLMTQARNGLLLQLCPSPSPGSVLAIRKEFRSIGPLGSKLLSFKICQICLKIEASLFLNAF